MFHDCSEPSGKKKIDKRFAKRTRVQITISCLKAWLTFTKRPSLLLSSFVNLAGSEERICPHA